MSNTSNAFHALEEALKNYGIELLNDPGRVLAVINDLAPQREYASERLQIQTALNAGIAQYVQKAYYNPEHCGDYLRSAVLLLEQNASMTHESSVVIVRSFARALGIPFIDSTNHATSSTTPHGNENTANEKAKNTPRSSRNHSVWILTAMVICLLAAVIIVFSILDKKNTSQPANERAYQAGNKPATEIDNPTEKDKDQQNSPYREYYNLCIEYQEKYGEASWPVTGHWRYMHGLCLVRCIDFDVDGTDELLLCYALNDAPEGREDYVCEIWGWSDGHINCLLKISDFDAGITLNGSWPIWVSIGSYLGRTALLTKDFSTKTLYWMENGQFVSITLRSEYSGDIMLDNGEYTYYVDGVQYDEKSFEVSGILDCFDSHYIIYEIKDGTGSVISSIGGDELIQFTNNNIANLKNR